MAEFEAISGAIALVGGLLLIAGLFSPVSTRFGVPMLLLFLGLGILAGSEGIGGVAFDDHRLAFRWGTVALVLILFDGGFNTSMGALRRVAAPAAALATVGVVLTAAAVGLIGWLLGLPGHLAVLLAVVVSSTDAAAVFAAFRSSGLRLEERVGTLIEVESGLNDPMAVVLTVAVTEYILGGGGVGWGELLHVTLQLAIGVAGGIAFGAASRFLLPLMRLPAVGLYPVITVAFAFISFGATSLAGGSGFMAVYLTGVMLSGQDLPYRAGVKRVQDALAWLSQMLMFLMLGLLVYPSRMLPDAGVGVALAVALAFVARPVAVLLTLVPFRVSWKEKLFVAWVGLRGAVPIILAVYPVLRGVAGGDRVFHLVFFIVLVNSIIPGTMVGMVARWLGLARPTVPEPPAGIDLVTAREYPGAFVWYQVTPPSAVAGSLVLDIPLPASCVLVMLVRGSDVIPPRGNTLLTVGDHVCVFVKHGERELLDLLFGYVEHHGG